MLYRECKWFCIILSLKQNGLKLRSVTLVLLDVFLNVIMLNNIFYCDTLTKRLKSFYLLPTILLRKSNILLGRYFNECIRDTILSHPTCFRKLVWEWCSDAFPKVIWSNFFWLKFNFLFANNKKSTKKSSKQLWQKKIFKDEMESVNRC